MPFPHLFDFFQKRGSPKLETGSYDDMYDDPLSLGENPGGLVGSVRLDAVTIAPGVKHRVLDYLREHRSDWIEALHKEGKRIGEVRLVHDIVEVVVEKEHEAVEFVREHEREIKAAGVASLVGTALAGSAIVARHLRTRSNLEKK